MSALKMILFCAYFVSLGSCSRRSRESTNTMKLLTSTHEKQDPKDEKYKKVASRAVRELDGPQCPRIIKKVLEVATGVVAGLDYFMTVVMCGFKDGCNTDSLVCDNCELKIWEKEYAQFIAVTRIKCSHITAWNYKRTARMMIK